jgi:hypothetical protein
MQIRSLAIGTALALAAAAAQADGMDVKPGLWERTTSVQHPGMPGMAALPEMAELPPEQRAQMEKMMGAMSGKPTVTRECITPEMLKQWEDYAKAHSEAGCTHEVRERSPQKVSMAMSCDGGRTTGTAEFTAPTPEQMTSAITTVSQREGGERRMKIESSARWLGADCGDVKPVTPKAAGAR